MSIYFDKIVNTCFSFCTTVVFSSPSQRIFVDGSCSLILICTYGFRWILALLQYFKCCHAVREWKIYWWKNYIRDVMDVTIWVDHSIHLLEKTIGNVYKTYVEVIKGVWLGRCHGLLTSNNLSIYTSSFTFSRSMSWEWRTNVT